MVTSYASSELAGARAAATAPSDAAVLFFSSGSTSQPKGILSAHRGVAIQLWRAARIFDLNGDVRCWSANGFFWSGNFCVAIGGTLYSRTPMAPSRRSLSAFAQHAHAAARQSPRG